MFHYRCNKCERRITSKSPGEKTCNGCGEVMEQLTATEKALGKGPSRERNIRLVQGRKTLSPKDRSAQRLPTSASSKSSTSASVRRAKLRKPANAEDIIYGDSRGCPSCDPKNNKRSDVPRDGFDHLPILRVCDATRTVCTLIAEEVEKRMTESEIATDPRINQKAGKSEADETIAALKSKNCGYMIGALLTDGTIFIAMSGQRSLPNFKYIVEEAQKDARFPTGDVKIIHDMPTRITAGGAKIGRDWAAEARDPDLKAGLFECAAPKIICSAIAARKGATGGFKDCTGIGWTMTEMWVGPSAGIRRHGAIQESCNNCKKVLPMQLCALAPIELVADSDGFTIVEGKAAKNKRKQGINPDSPKKYDKDKTGGGYFGGRDTSKSGTTSSSNFFDLLRDD